MSIILSILTIIAAMIALLLIIALFTKKEYSVQSETVIDAPLQKVFDYIRHIKNQDNYNKWVMVDAGMKKEFKGTDGTEGFIYAWNGNKKAGEGEQEIKKITEARSVATEIRFIRPFAGVANAVMETAPVSENKTLVKWSNVSKMKYPMNLMVSFIEKMLVKDMNTSLTRLKAILEKQ